MTYQSVNCTQYKMRQHTQSNSNSPIAELDMDFDFRNISKHIGRKRKLFYNGYIATQDAIGNPPPEKALSQG